MKDSAKLLNFNVNRELKFSVFRPIDFDPRRALSFNVNRNLSFSSRRDLGFGKHGVVFRGYVCSVCGSPVAKDAPQCDACGVKFEQSVKQQAQKQREDYWGRNQSIQEADKPPTETTQQPHQNPPIRKAPAKASPPQVRTSPPQAQTPQRRNSFECPVCSRILFVGVTQCPSCSTQFGTPSAVPSLQPNPTVQTVVFCASCNYNISPNDRFCRRCGSPRPKGNTLVTWDDSRISDGGIISWDESSTRGG